MKIDRNRPLPAHTKYKYEECFAKIILEHLFPQRYIDLKIEDRPDLQDLKRQIGVEVTSAVPPEDREACSLWTSTVYMDNGPQKIRKIDRLAQLGVHYTGGVQVWPSKSYQTDSLEKSPYWTLIQTFDGKIQKLNQGHYVELRQYDLFVHSELFIWPQESELQLARLLQEMILRNDCGKHFTNVYLLGICALYKWRLEDNRYELIPLTSSDFLRYGWDARELVIQKEEMMI